MVLAETSASWDTQRAQLAASTFLVTESKWIPIYNVWRSKENVTVSLPLDICLTMVQYVECMCECFSPWACSLMGLLQS
jgi:hypothetical protein